MGVSEVRTPESRAEWRAYYALRWRILRAPWQPSGARRDATDETSIHRMACTGDGRVVAVGRLHRLDDHTGQIRYMAVESGCERRGHGTRVLASLEQAAMELGLDSIILHAREQAVPFYSHHGYRTVEASLLLFDEIQHYLMSKHLAPPSRASTCDTKSQTDEA